MQKYAESIIAYIGSCQVKAPSLTLSYCPLTEFILGPNDFCNTTHAWKPDCMCTLAQTELALLWSLCLQRSFSLVIKNSNTVSKISSKNALQKFHNKDIYF